jgi:hypothetical protein
MITIALSLILTVLLLALPGMTWAAHKTRRQDPHDMQRGKLLFRLIVGCTVVAWGGQALHYLLLSGAENSVELRTAVQVSAPLGWLVWLAALTGTAAFIIFLVKTRR